MKNRKLLSSLFAGLLLFSACETDRDSNPTLTVPESFVLNVPAMASGTYDLDNSSSVELTCTQPDYGYTAPVVYTVEASLDSSFDSVETLTSTYTSAQMEVSASELAVAVTNLKIAEGLSDADFPLSTTVQVRLKADLSNIEATVYSNSIELNVFLSYSLPPVTYPENMYLIGAHCDWNWDTATVMTSVYGAADYDYNGQFWAMVYFPASAGLKINTATSWNGGDLGYDGVTVVDNATADVSADGDGNICIANAGWYIVRVTTVIDGVNLLYTVEFNSPNVYLYGDTNGGDWDALEANLFTVPADGTGEFASPAFAAAGEIRAAVVLPDTDWWKSEFIVSGGVLSFRANGPDQDRVSGSAGQKLYINFTDGTGRVE